MGGVAVVADNTWTAQRALDALDIEFEAGDNGSFNTEEYKQQLLRNVEAPAKVEFEKGSLEQAFKDAAKRHSATYETGFSVAFSDRADVRPGLGAGRQM